MRKISATYIISNTGKPLKNGILVLNEDNSIAELIDRKGSVKEIQNLEYYSGVLVPGFVDVFTFLSWPNMNSSLIQSSDLSSLTLGEVADIKNVSKAINHLEAYGTKGAADFFPTQDSCELKMNSNLNIRDIHDISDLHRNQFYSDFPDSILGRLFTNNISSDKTFCIGTGSLTSHLKLSVFDELKYLQTIKADLKLEKLIEWACLNGAKALGFDQLGSFEIGKKPGVNLITNIDYNNFCLKPESKLKVLV